MGIITETTRDRMVELENQKQGIKIDIARTEIKKTTLTAKQVQFWLDQFRDGSIDDPTFKIRLVNTFIRSIVLFDDRIVITYNFCQDNSNNRCTLDFDIETYKKTESVGVRLIPPKCRRPESNRYEYRYPQDFKSCASASSATPAGKWDL